MKIRRIYFNFKETKYFLIVFTLFAFLINLTSLNSWLENKEPGFHRDNFLKLTKVLSEIGTTYKTSFLFQTVQQARINWVPKNINNERLVFGLNLESENRRPTTISNTFSLPPLINSLSQDILEPSNSEDWNSLDELLKSDQSDGDGGNSNGMGSLVIGDSILKSGLKEHIERFYQKYFPAMRVRIRAQSGTGLSRPDVFDWISYIKNEPGKFNDVIIFLGTNDAQNLFVDNQVINFGTREWNQYYSLRVKELIRSSCNKSGRVVWVSSLRMRSETLDKKLAQLNKVVQTEIEANPSCAVFVSVEKWFTKKSKFTENWSFENKGVRKNIKIRSDDGIHLTFKGAEIFAQKLIEKIYE